jgi:hypothetical protein
MAIGHWKDKLSIKYPFVVDSDASGDEAESFVNFTIDGNFLSELLKFCSNRNITLPMILIVAQSVAIARYSGNPNALIKAIHFGRDQSVLYNQVGNYTTMLPVRIDLGGDQTLDDLFENIRVTWREFLSSTPVYLDEMRESSTVRICPRFNYRDVAALSRGDVAASSGNAGDIMPSLYNIARPSYSWKNRNYSSTKAIFSDLMSLSVYKFPDRLMGYFTYGRENYSENKMNEVAGAFLSFLRTAIYDPRMKVAKIFSSTSTSSDKLSHWTHSELGSTGTFDPFRAQPGTSSS